ncbi:MAG: hypothetical protein RL224_733 [Actinomycetota bacterium]
MISILIAEGAIVHHTELPMPAILYGIIAMAAFLALAGITWSYRDVSNRNPRRSQRAGH